jgi:hypothetical protein
MNSQLKSTLGWALVAMSFTPWAVYAGLPFVALPPDAAATAAAAAFVFGQIAFVAGLALIGRDTITLLRKRLACASRRAS